MIILSGPLNRSGICLRRFHLNDPICEVADLNTAFANRRESMAGSPVHAPFDSLRAGNPEILAELTSEKMGSCASANLQYRAINKWLWSYRTAGHKYQVKMQISMVF